MHQETDDTSPDALRARVAELEAENARLRQVEAAAKEARACLEGRRPGFSATYVADLLRAALQAGEEEATPAFPVMRGGGNPRRRGQQRRNR